MKKKSVKEIASIIVFIAGVITLLAGVVFLLVRLLNNDEGISDGEYLVESGVWALNATSAVDEEATESTDIITNCSNNAETNCMSIATVIWDFTEVGKGTLTTNAHVNDYDFIWAIEGDKLKIETSWLYPLENEYIYALDQEKGVLRLTSGDKVYTFVTNMEQN